MPVSTKAEAEELNTSNKPLNALTKAEASEWLRMLGEEPRVRWTSVEIKSRIKEIVDLVKEEDQVGHEKLRRFVTRLNKLKTTPTPAEKHYTGTESGSWQNLHSDKAIENQSRASPHPRPKRWLRF